MRLSGYLIQKNEIPEKKFNDLLDAYSDINLHLANKPIPEHTLVTIITDINKDSLAIDLNVPTAKLHKVDYNSRRTTGISSTLFVIDDTNFEITTETVGDYIHRQYIAAKTVAQTGQSISKIQIKTENNTQVNRKTNVPCRTNG